MYILIEHVFHCVTAVVVAVVVVDESKYKGKKLSAPRSAPQ